MTQAKSTAGATPLCFLPEPEFGQILQGCGINDARLTGSDHISVDPGGAGGTRGYSTALMKGMRCRVKNNDYTIASVLYSGSGVPRYEIYFETLLLEDTAPGDDFYIHMIPFPHQVSKWDPNEDFNRDSYGQVGSGVTDNQSSQGGREFNGSIDGRKGRDIYRHYPNVALGSSVFAMMMLQDGLLVDHGSYFGGDIRSDTVARSFTVAWLIDKSTNDIRLVPGCIVRNTEETFGEDMEAQAELTADLGGQYELNPTVTELATYYNIIPTSDPYLGPSVRTHGLVDIRWRFGLGLIAPYIPGENYIDVEFNSVLEFGDTIIISNKFGQEDERTVDSLGGDRHRVYFTGGPLTNNYEENTSWCTQKYNSRKHYPMRELSVKTMPGFMMLGDISEAVDYKTQVVANKMLIEIDASFRRATNLLWRLQRANQTRIKTYVEVWEYESSYDKSNYANMYREFPMTIVSPVREPMDNEKGEISDEISLKLSGTPTLQLLTDFLPSTP